MRILLGPSHDLHAGVHGALTDWPAPGVEYVERTYSMYFQHQARPRVPFSPVNDHSECEWFRFDDEEDVDLVHAARFPVDTRLPWVVDSDCLVLPLRFGEFFAFGMHRGAPHPSEAQIREREAFMVARYAYAYCGRIMLRSEQAKRQFLGTIAENDLINERTRDILAEKTQVVYPAVRAAPLCTKSSGRPLLFFMGRSFVDKGGLLALAVIERLRAVHGHSFDATVVSVCPARVNERLASLGVEVQQTTERSEYLNRLAGADIFFSPTLFENFGMGLIEAAAAGAAIVTSCGPGMEHIGELFENRKEALLVSNSLSDEARVASYVEAIGMLIRNPDLRRTLAFNAYALASHGHFSLARHNQELAEIYDAALNLAASTSSSPPPLSNKASFTDPRHVLIWSEQMCHWTVRRHAPHGGLRICV
jgi:glycosyltransferase involved in cell wall biosynthesis